MAYRHDQRYVFINKDRDHHYRFVDFYEPRKRILVHAVKIHQAGYAKEQACTVSGNLSVFIP